MDKLRDICDCSLCRYAILWNELVIRCELNLKTKQIYCYGSKEYIVVPDSENFICEFYNE